MDLLHLVQGPQEASRSRSEFRRPGDRRRHGSGASRSTESGWHMAGARRRYQALKYFLESKHILDPQIIFHAKIFWTQKKLGTQKYFGP